jgi:DNA-binding MarR family transcriptional regulator
MTIDTGVPASNTQIDAIQGELRVFLDELRCVGSERMVKQGVSMTHLHILSLLGHHGELTMSQIADLLDVSLSNATGVVDRVEERGLVERMRDNVDRRVVTVRLTDDGRRYLNDLQLIKADLIQKVLERLSASDLERVGEALRSLRTAAMSVADDPAIAPYWHAHRHSDAHRSSVTHAAPHHQGGTPTT